MARLMLSLLGPFQAFLDGKAIGGFESDRVRALLAYLAVERASPHPRLALTGLLWPGWPEPSALTNLRNALAVLRKAIGDREAAAPLLRVARDALQFEAGAEAWVDVIAFQTLTAPGQPPACLAQGVALYRGPFLEGFSLKDSPAFEDWLLAQREQLQRQCLAALERLSDHYTQSGDLAKALEYSWKQVDLAPWHEEAQRGLMRLLALSGQRSAALAQYETCRHLLQKELGVEPAAETNALYECIRSGEIAAASPGPAPLSCPSAYAPAPASITADSPVHLPAWLPPFIGRKRLVAEVRARLVEPACRLLTLSGPGGSGKTRLAVEAAAGLAGEFPDGVYFVPLQALPSVESIQPAVAQGLGLVVVAREDPRRMLMDFLREKALLLVLDNFEHLVAGAELLADILQDAPRVKILVTSRIPLNLLAEHLLPVPGMRVPETLPEDLARLHEYGSVRLFLDAARRAAPGFTPDRAGLEQVVRICRLVGGLPLGILLAAGWLRLLGPGEIADEIAAHSLDFLEGDWQELPERQRSLRAVFDYSWRLLSPREQQVFAGLALFRGGFSYPAAQQVCGASLRDLLKLAHHSLLERSPGGRYRLHELLRQYGEEQLAAQPDGGQALRERCAEFFLASLERLGADCKGPRQLEALAELDLEIENIRAAWDWAVEHSQVERLARGMQALGWYYYGRCRAADGAQAFRQAAERLAQEGSPRQPEIAKVWAYLRAWQGCFYWHLGHVQQGYQLMNDSVKQLEGAAEAGQEVRRYLADALMLLGYIIGDEPTIQKRLNSSLAMFQDLNDFLGASRALSLLAGLAQKIGDYPKAVTDLQECLAIRRSLGTPLEIAYALEGYAFVLGLMGRLKEAEQMARENVALCRQMGDPSRLAGALHTLTSNLNLSGQYAEALEPAAECTALHEKTGDLPQAARGLLRLGRAQAGLAQYDAAQAAFERSLNIYRGYSHPSMIGFASWNLGELFLAQGKWDEAQRLLAESLAIMKSTGNRGSFAIPTAELALVALHQGESGQARLYMSKALELVSAMDNYFSSVGVLSVTAVFLAESGQAERALELWALAGRHPLIANSALWQDIAGKPVAAQAALLPPEAAAAAQERGRQRDLQATIAELAAEFQEKA